MVRFLPALHSVLALLLYGVNANFTVILFTSGFLGWEALVRLVFAIAFEGAKVVLWLEALLRRSAVLGILAIAFSLGSLTTATLGMVMSELLQAEQKEVYAEERNSEVTDLESVIERIQNEIAIEQARLAGGSSIYRTDAKETRSRLDELDGQLQAAQQARREAQARVRTEAAQDRAAIKNPLAEMSQRLGSAAQAARLGFGGYQALMLELGGMATAALALGRRRKKQAASSAAEDQAEPPAPGADVEGAGTPEGPSVVPGDPVDALGRIAFSPRARNGSFPGYGRVQAAVDRAAYDDVVRRGLLAGVLRRRAGRIYLSHGVTREEFEEGVRLWPN